MDISAPLGCKAGFDCASMLAKTHFSPQRSQNLHATSGDKEQIGFFVICEENVLNGVKIVKKLLGMC